MPVATRNLARRVLGALAPSLGLFSSLPETFALGSFLLTLLFRTNMYVYIYIIL
jgi:hypothetical protein